MFQVGPFQRSWLERYDTVVKLTNSQMPKEDRDFVNEYMDVGKGSLKSTNLLSSPSLPLNEVGYGQLTERSSKMRPLQAGHAHDFPSLPTRHHSHHCHRVLVSITAVILILILILIPMGEDLDSTQSRLLTSFVDPNTQLQSPPRRPVSY